MRLSIRSRMILSMNLLVAVVGSAVGLAGIEVATSQVERRLVSESAANAAELLSTQNWPLSDGLMSQSARLLGAEAAALAPEDNRVLSSSLPAPARSELQRQLESGGAEVAAVSLGEQRYRVGSAMIRRRPAAPSERPQQRRLVLLVPEQRVVAAQRQVAWRIGLLTLLAIVIATAVAFWLSMSIARPIRRLVDRMDRLGEAAEGETRENPAPSRPAGPSELVRLARSFDELLDRLAAARQQLDRSARLAGLGQLAASVAHELRNPLSGIKMNVRVLADELGPEAAAEHVLDHIIRETDRMDLYLQELLSLAVDSAGSDDRPAPVEPVDVGEQVDSVIKLLSGRCEHAGVEVAAEVDSESGKALGDAGRVRQVILNLALNALDVMPYGGKLEIRVTPASAGEDVRVEVGDTGPGVETDPGADIFEPFVSTKPQGAGLGLYICRRIVDGLGGRLGYRNRERGATFWFELPAAGTA